MVNSYNSDNLYLYGKWRKCFHWSSTAYPLLWSFLSPSIWNLWKAQAEKYWLRKDHQSQLDVPDAQGKKWEESEPETFTVPWRNSKPLGSLPKPWSQTAEVLAILYLWPRSVLTTQHCLGWSFCDGPLTVFSNSFQFSHQSPGAATGPAVVWGGSRAWGLAAILKFDKVTHLRLSDSAIFKCHNPAGCK